MALVGDIKSTLRALLPLVEEKPIASFWIKRWKITATPAKGWMI